MNDGTRSLIEMSLSSRSVDETYALFRDNLAVGVSKREIVSVRQSMVDRGLLRTRNAGPNHYRNAEPIAPTDGADRAEKAEGCARLLRAQLRTGQFFGKQRAEWLARHGTFA